MSEFAPRSILTVPFEEIEAHCRLHYIPARYIGRMFKVSDHVFTVPSWFTCNYYVRFMAMFERAIGAAGTIITLHVPTA